MARTKKRKHSEFRNAECRYLMRRRDVTDWCGSSLGDAMRRLLVMVGAFAVAISAPEAQQAEYPWVGVWGDSAAQCSSNKKIGEEEGAPQRLTSTEITALETYCKIQSISIGRQPGTWRLKSKCESEGRPFHSDTTLRLTADGRLIMGTSKVAMVRCETTADQSQVADDSGRILVVRRADRPSSLGAYTNFNRQECQAGPAPHLNVTNKPSVGTLVLSQRAQALDQSYGHCAGKQANFTFVAYETPKNFVGDEFVEFEVVFLAHTPNGMTQTPKPFSYLLRTTSGASIQSSAPSTPRIGRTKDNEAVIVVPLPLSTEEEGTIQVGFNFGLTKALVGSSADLAFTNSDRNLVAVNHIPATKSSYVHLFLRGSTGDLLFLNNVNARVARLLQGQWAETAKHYLSVEGISGRIISLSTMDFRGNDRQQFKFSVRVDASGSISLAQNR